MNVFIPELAAYFNVKMCQWILCGTSYIHNKRKVNYCYWTFSTKCVFGLHCEYLFASGNKRKLPTCKFFRISALFTRFTSGQFLYIFNAKSMQNCTNSVRIMRVCLIKLVIGIYQLLYITRLIFERELGFFPFSTTYNSASFSLFTHLSVIYNTHCFIKLLFQWWFEYRYSWCANNTINVICVTYNVCILLTCLQLL